MGIFDNFFGINSDINKTHKEDIPENAQGVVSDKLPELKLEMDNEKIAILTDKWKATWDNSNEKQKWLERADENERYWLGNHYNRPEQMVNTERPLTDNAMFEALETFLPQATRRNPEPIVILDDMYETELNRMKADLEDMVAQIPPPVPGQPNDPQAEQAGQQVDAIEKRNKQYETYCKDTMKRLGKIADKQKLRLILKQIARNWAISLLGVVKVGWDMDYDIPTVVAVRAQKLILDPKATVSNQGYTGEYIGEIRKEEASWLRSMIKNTDTEDGAMKVIDEMVSKQEGGTQIQFIEWNTQQYTCWTIGRHVLLKRKNANWNYDKTEEPTELPQMDEMGQELPQEPQEVKGENHFPVPKIPYIFLSIFNLGKQPMDDTSLITQNLANQDEINTLNRQIHDNIKNMNGAWIGSLARAGMTKEQFTELMNAVRRGGGGTIPDGAPRDAIEFYSGTPLPGDVFNNLVDKRNRLADIFGTRGSTAAGVSNEDTVRGKLITRGLDTDRIGGGVSEYLEQFADDIYNWWVQLLYVYDESYVTLKDKPKIEVSVKEGSLLPKDSTTLANQAIELSSAGKMSDVDLYKRLDYPNPEEMAANNWLQINAPQLLFKDDPRVQEAIAAMQQPVEEKKPMPTGNIKDMTPDAASQALALMGIQSDPEGIAAYQEEQKSKEMQGQQDMSTFNAALKPEPEKKKPVPAKK